MKEEIESMRDIEKFLDEECYIGDNIKNCIIKLMERSEDDAIRHNVEYFCKIFNNPNQRMIINNLEIISSRKQAALKTIELERKRKKEVKEFQEALKTL